METCFEAGNTYTSKGLPVPRKYGPKRTFDLVTVSYTAYILEAKDCLPVKDGVITVFQCPRYKLPSENWNELNMYLFRNIDDAAIFQNEVNELRNRTCCRKFLISFVLMLLGQYFLISHSCHLNSITTFILSFQLNQCIINFLSYQKCWKSLP